MTRVTMLLARAPDRPDGDIDDRIELRVALNNQGSLDTEATSDSRDAARVFHVVGDIPQLPGELVRTDASWAIRRLDAVDAPLVRLDLGVIRPGELVTLHDDVDGPRIYRIVAVETDAT